MKIGLYASMNNGDVFNKDIPYIAVDGGLEHLHRQSIKPLCAIGDFDSLQHKEYLEGLEVLTFPTHKDETDTELAISEALNRGYDEIDLYVTLFMVRDLYVPEEWGAPQVLARLKQALF